MKIPSIKSLLLASAFISAAQFGFGLETGGLLSNDTKFANQKKDGDLELTQKNAVNFWIRHPLSENGLSYFVAEGEFRSQYDAYKTDSKKKLTLAADATLFKFIFKKELSNSDITLSLGRFYNSDLSSLVYSQNGDGAKLDLEFSKARLSLFGAYTGLLNAKNITIIGQSPDFTDKEKTLYVLAKKYGVGSVTLAFPNFLLRQTLALEGLGAFSLESEKLNRFYATASLSGPIVAPVFYSVSSTFSFSKYEEEEMKKGNLTKGSISVYPNLKSMSISLNGLYASGKQGSFEAFQGFTSKTAVNSLYEPEYTALVLVGPSMSIKALPNLLLKAGGDIVFDAEKDIEHKGYQLTASLNYQAASDVSLGASFDQYIGKENSDNDKMQIKLKAALAF